MKNEELGSLRSIAEMIQKQKKESNQIFTRSLDPLVQQKEQLLERNLFYWKKEMVKKKDERDREIEKEEYVQKKLHLNQILSGQKRVVILANVGEGKSTQLAMWKDEIENNPAYHNHIPMFYTASSCTNPEQIQTEVQRIKHMFPQKQIVLFMDGIDEFSTEAKQTLQEQLKSSNSFGLGEDNHVIYGSRKAGFDEHGEEGKYTSLHFDKLKPNQTDDYLSQRLKSLGIPTSNIEEHKERIQKFLQQGMLEEDLKQTPLILYFLCQMSLSNGNKSLEQIHNRAELYEEIVKKILKDHQKKKKLEWSDNMTQILMKTLSDCAYQSFKGKEISEDVIWEQMKQYEPALDEQEKRDYVEQIFLLYKNVGGHYQFILKSFQEYFLARYLAENPQMKQSSETYEGFTKGDEEIFQVRDTNENNWNNLNEWRNFKPVELFYGQMMGNRAQTDEKKTHLRRLLGINQEGKIDMNLGLLKNDDMFGENFFLGLMVIFSLPERELKTSMLEAYQSYIEKKWDLNDIRPRTLTIIQFSRDRQDNTTFHPIFEKLKKKANELMGEKEYWKAHYIYVALAESGDKEAFKMAKEGAEKLIGEEEYLEVSKIYVALVKSGDKEALQMAKEGAEKLIGEGEYLEASKIYVALVKSGDKEALQMAKEGAKALMKKKKYWEASRIYVALVESGDKEALQMAKEGAERLMKTYQYWQAHCIYVALAESGDKEALQMAQEGAKALMGKRQYEEVSRIYVALMESGDTEALQMAKEGAKALMEKKKYEEASWIYVALVESGDTEALQIAKEGAKALMKKKKYEEASWIYVALVESGDTEALQMAKEGAAELMEKGIYSEAGNIYETLKKLPYRIPL
jgi:hypothetical protein